MKNYDHERDILKKAQIPLKALTGILIGVMLLITMFATGKELFSFNKKEYEESFNEFAQTLQVVAGQSEHTVDTPLLKLKEKCSEKFKLFK